VVITYDVSEGMNDVIVYETASAGACTPVHLYRRSTASHFHIELSL